MKDNDFEKRALKIIESLDTSKIEIFKTWNYTPRGPNGIWFRTEEDSILYRCYYFDYIDSSELIIFDFNNFITDFALDLQPVKLDDRISIIRKDSIKVIGSDGKGYDSLIQNNILEDSLFKINSPFSDLEYLSDMKDSLHFIMVHYYARLGGIFQFYLSTQHVLTYIPNIDLIDPQYRQVWLNDFSSGKILRDKWSLKKLKEPIDLN